MAERRMFSCKVVESDKFIDLPHTTQALYFHLCMYADDDGFVNNVNSIIRSLGLQRMDLMLLAESDFVMTFDSGVILIRHWKAQNLIKKDRYRPTDCLEEKDMVKLNEKNKTYEFVT